MEITRIVYLNEKGKRSSLEDTIFPSPGAAGIHHKLFIVCDGVGGLSKGEEASRIACEAVSTFILSASVKSLDAAVIEDAVNHAIQKMRLYADAHPDACQMSTTLTLAFLQKNSVLAAWCGDSRIYHIRNGAVLWQSTDHSMVQQLIDLGQITAAEAGNHPQKNVILRSLSAANGNAATDIHVITDTRPGDYILLCTDGLLENINESILMDILGPEQEQNDKKALFLQHCENKTNDNFSMYLLEMGTAELENSNRKNLFLFLAALVLAAIIIAGIFYLRQPHDALPAKVPVATPVPSPAYKDSASPNLQHKADSTVKDDLKKHAGNSMTSADSVLHAAKEQKTNSAVLNTLEKHIKKTKREKKPSN